MFTTNSNFTIGTKVYDLCFLIYWAKGLLSTNPPILPILQWFADHWASTPVMVWDAISSGLPTTGHPHRSWCGTRWVLWALGRPCHQCAMVAPPMSRPHPRVGYGRGPMDMGAFPRRIVSSRCCDTTLPGGSIRSQILPGRMEGRKSVPQ